MRTGPRRRTSTAVTCRTFHEALRDFGYKVIVKPVKWYVNEDGKRFGKANSDLDMAVNVLLEARNIDRVLLATGDGDFAKVARALQNMGCRVEVVAFDNVSGDLRREADLFVSGYLIPGLLPGESRALEWGREGSRVRGLCYWYDQEKNFGFIRYLRSLSGPLWGDRHHARRFALFVDVRAQQRAAAGRGPSVAVAEPAPDPGVHAGTVADEAGRPDGAGYCGRAEGPTWRSARAGGGGPGFGGRGGGIQSWRLTASRICCARAPPA